MVAVQMIILWLAILIFAGITARLGFLLWIDRDKSRRVQRHRPRN